MKGITIAEECHVINALPPIDVGGAAKTSDYFSLGKYAHATIIVTMGVVTNDTNLLLYESDDNAGSDESAIVFDYYEEKTAAGDTLTVRKTATVAGIQTGTNNSTTFVIEVDAAQLSDGYPYLALKTDNAAAALISAVAILSGSRYAQEQTPTAIT